MALAELVDHHGGSSAERLVEVTMEAAGAEGLTVAEVDVQESLRGPVEGKREAVEWTAAVRVEKGVARAAAAEGTLNSRQTSQLWLGRPHSIPQGTPRSR